MKLIATAISAGILCASINVSAEQFNVQPRAGLWQSESQVLIDGVDVVAQVKAMQEQMMAQLPEEARQAAGLSAPSQDDLTCLSQEQADAAQDVDQWLEQLSQEGCQINKVSQTANSIEFKATCDGSSGVTGEYTGRMLAENSKSWSMTMQGMGSMGFGGNPVKQEISVSGKWLKDDCGNVPVEE